MPDELSASSVASWPPPGNYALVVLFGRAEIVGRISEAEVCGVRMLAVEALVGGEMLPPAYFGHHAIFSISPLGARAALSNSPRRRDGLPVPVRVLA